MSDQQMPNTDRRKEKVFHKQINLGSIVNLLSIIGGIGYAIWTVAGYQTSSERRLVVVENTQRVMSQLLSQQQVQINMIFDKMIPGDHADNAE